MKTPGVLWTPEEEQTLRRLVEEGVPWPGIVREMGRAKGSLEGKAYRMGIKLPAIRPVWTPEEDQELRDLLGAHKTIAEVAQLMGRTYCSIQGRIDALDGVRALVKLHPNGERIRMWTKPEVAKLLLAVEERRNQEDIARELGRSRQAINVKLRGNLGVHWDQGFVSLTSIANEFGVSYKAVNTVVHNLCWDEKISTEGGIGQVRYRFDYDQADRIRRVLAGKIRHHRGRYKNLREANAKK